jgi:multidrug transporter EmrE-like cation transporter
MIVTVHSAMTPRGGSGSGVFFGSGAVRAEGFSATLDLDGSTAFYCTGKADILWVLLDMSATTTVSEHKPFTKQQSIILVFVCTLLGAAAQILMKMGSTQMQHFDVIKVLTNLPLFTGYALYGINTVLLMFALRDGELSKLYPIIALTYVWVTILSLYFFHESLTFWKVAGIAIIVAGVSVLGRASNPPSPTAGILE